MVNGKAWALAGMARAATPDDRRVVLSIVVNRCVDRSPVLAREVFGRKAVRGPMPVQASIAAYSSMTLPAREMTRAAFGKGTHGFLMVLRAHRIDLIGQ